MPPSSSVPPPPPFSAVLLSVDASGCEQVPPLLRPFSTGFVSMCFAVYISWITHRREAMTTREQQQAEATG